jgi:beta-phosphoglucomutase-like phosphatase (HAD superfamily)
MKPSAVLFDCDGVLVDSEPETLRVIHEDLIAHGMDITLHEMEERFVGGTVRTGL